LGARRGPTSPGPQRVSVAIPGRGPAFISRHPPSPLKGGEVVGGGRRGQARRNGLTGPRQLRAEEEAPPLNYARGGLANLHQKQERAGGALVGRGW
jgi:hypothetical protein